MVEIESHQPQTFQMQNEIFTINILTSLTSHQISSSHKYCTSSPLQGIVSPSCLITEQQTSYPSISELQDLPCPRGSQTLDYEPPRSYEQLGQDKYFFKPDRACSGKVEILSKRVPVFAFLLCLCKLHVKIPVIYIV